MGVFIVGNGKKVFFEFLKPIGECDGFGEWKSLKGICYKGHWKNGKQDGKGEGRDANGISYKGIFKGGWLKEARWNESENLFISEKVSEIQIK